MTDFNRRFAKLERELHSLYLGLYHDQQAYAYFCSMLKKQYAQRKESLRQLDARREENPGWYKDQKMLGMQIYTQCFGGNLKGEIGRAHV